MSPRDEVAWWGHAMTTVQLSGQVFLTDPLLRERVGPLLWGVRPLRRPPSHALSAVLVSHLHLDHCDLPSLRQLDPDIPVVVPRGGGRLMQKAGRRAVVELAVGESVTFDRVAVHAVHAEHDGRRGRYGRPQISLGYVLAGPERTVYFAGDTDVYPEMELLRDYPVDLALLPVGGWGLTLGEGHCDPERAAQAAQAIRPVRAVPIHWGSLRIPAAWRLNPARFTTPGREFAEAARRLAPGVDVVVSDHGTPVEIVGHLPAPDAGERP